MYLFRRAGLVHDAAATLASSSGVEHVRYAVNAAQLGQNWSDEDK